MTIPAFDSISNTLPPHLGTGGQVASLWPYDCTVEEVCDRFGTSQERTTILEGFLSLREEFFKAGVQGFQWLDGSFVEDIETQEGRHPGDMDVVSFILTPGDPVVLAATINALNPLLLDRTFTKATYHIDHFWVALGSPAEKIVELTRYTGATYLQHRRDRSWKGMLRVNLSDPADDAAAKIVLSNKP